MNIVRSIGITAIISAIVGFALRTLLGFWEIFSLAAVLQFVAFFTYNSYQITKTTQNNTEADVAFENLLALSEADIVCPCGNYTVRDYVYAGIENTFKCEKCSNTFKVSITLTPTLVTEPVDINQTFEDLIRSKGTSV